MLVKVFTSKGPLSGLQGKLHHRGNQFYTMDWTPSLEQEINRWLSQNPAITITEIRQSLAFGWFHRPHCVVSIWYEPPKIILTKEAAEKLVMEHVRGPENRDDIVISEVIERSFGWVFCYNSKRHVETGDDKHCLLGNHPILVDRYKCTLHSIEGFDDIKEYIDRYEKAGQASS
jgi:hypothetical protein